MAGREGRKIYSTHRWAWTRRAVLRAAGYRCAGCGRGAREVDHVKAVSHGGAAFEMGNLQPLCRKCHFSKSRSDRGVEQTPWQRLVKELRASQGTGRAPPSCVPGALRGAAPDPTAPPSLASIRNLR